MSRCSPYCLQVVLIAWYLTVSVNTVMVIFAPSVSLTTRSFMRVDAATTLAIVFRSLVVTEDVNFAMVTAAIMAIELR